MPVEQTSQEEYRRGHGSTSADRLVPYELFQLRLAINAFSENLGKWLASAVNAMTHNSEVLTAIQNLDRKVDLMSSNIDRIEKEAADLTEDAVVIKGALGDLKALVTDLKAQVAQGQLDQARLDAAASTLEKVDDELDALTAPEPAPTEPPA